MENGICICQDAQNTIVFKKWKMMDLNRKQNLEEDKISKTVLLYPVQWIMVSAKIEDPSWKEIEPSSFTCSICKEKLI